MKNLYFLIALLLILGCRKDNIEVIEELPKEEKEINEKVLLTDSILLHNDFASNCGFSLICFDQNRFLVAVSEKNPNNEKKTFLYLTSIEGNKIIILDKVDLGNFYVYFQLERIINTNKFLFVSQKPCCMDESSFYHECNINSGYISTDKIFISSDYLFHEYTTKVAIKSIDENKFLLAYSSTNGEGFQAARGSICIGHLSGTNFKFENEFVFADNNVNFLNLVPISNNYFIIGYANSLDSKTVKNKIKIGFFNELNEISFLDSTLLFTSNSGYNMGNQTLFEASKLSDEKFLVSFIDYSKVEPLWIYNYSIKDNKLSKLDSLSLGIEYSSYLSMSKNQSNELIIAYENYDAGYVRLIKANEKISLSTPKIFWENAQWFKSEIQSEYGIVVYRDQYTDNSYLCLFSKDQLIY